MTSRIFRWGLRGSSSSSSCRAMAKWASSSSSPSPRGQGTDHQIEPQTHMDLGTRSAVLEPCTHGILSGFRPCWLRYENDRPQRCADYHGIMVVRYRIRHLPRPAAVPLQGGATRARRTHALHTCHNGADNMSVYVQCFFDKITAVFHSVGGSRFSHDWQRTGQALVSGYDSASWFPIAFLMNEKYTGYKITPSSQQRRNPKLRRNSDVIYLVVCRCVRFEQSFLMRVKSSANSEYGQVQR